jgi:replicative DNA helicase
MTSDLLTNAEISVIGSVFLEPQSLRLIDLRPDDFMYTQNQEVFREILEIDRNGGVVDPLVILKSLNARGVEAEPKTVLEYMEVTPTAANVEAYADIVKNAAMARRLRNVGKGICDALDGAEDYRAVMIDATAEMTAMGENSASGDVITSSDALVEFYRYRAEVDKNPGKGYFSTGFANLDGILGGGLMRGEYYILAARTSMGKTSIALQIADYIAQKNGPTLYVSLEMTHRQITAKRLARLTAIGAKRLLNQPLTEEEYRKVAVASNELSKIPLAVNRKPTATALDIQNMALKSKAQMVVIDYLGLVKPNETTKQREKRNEQVAELSHGLKTLALKLDIPIVCLVQINREAEAKSDKRPQMSNLRDSGDIEQDADAIMMIYRPAYYTKDAESQQYEHEDMEIIVEKNRMGDTGTAYFAWYGAPGKAVPMRKEKK